LSGQKRVALHREVIKILLNLPLVSNIARNLTNVWFHLARKATGMKKIYSSLTVSDA
jgi:hypothetical protein